MESRRRLRELIASSGIVQAVGVADAGHAKLVEEAGFPVVYMSGSYVSFTHGWPDAGLLTVTEMAARAASIADRVKIPLIADADEGYGASLQIMRTVHEYERAGVAALHIEDMAAKKRGAPVPIPDMVKRIKAALEARTDPDLAIIARTDAMATWRTGLDGAAARREDCLKRSVAYAEAGADLVMVMHPDSADTLGRFCREVPKPIAVIAGQVATTKGVAPFKATPLELEQAGVRMAIFATFLLTKMVPVARGLLSELCRTGHGAFTDEEREQRHSLNTLLGHGEMTEVQARYGE